MTRVAPTADRLPRSENRIMLRLTSLKCLALALCAATTLSARAADADDAKAVAVKFVEAITAGDNKAIDENATGSKEEFEIVKSMAQVMPAVMNFKKACDAKFGPQNILSKGMANNPDLAAQAKAAEYKIEGDVATAIDKAKPNDKNPMKLKKVDGKWKVDLGSMGAEGAEIAKKAPAMAKVFNEAAKEINEGKYKTAEEAAVGLAPKMAEAMK